MKVGNRSVQPLLCYEFLRFYLPTRERKNAGAELQRRRLSLQLFNHKVSMLSHAHDSANFFRKSKLSYQIDGNMSLSTHLSSSSGFRAAQD